MLVAIDTATDLAGLALYDPAGGRILAEEAWISARMHTVELMPRLVRMMDQQGVAPPDLTGLVVSLGPGSFTGLRIGLGVAKGLALAQSLPLVGIPTLDAVARPHMTQPLPIWAVLQAGRGRICAALYARQRGRWRLREPYRLTTLAELCEAVDEPVLFCGEIDAAGAASIRRRLGSAPDSGTKPEVVIATPAATLRRAGYLAELGWERLARADVDDVATLSPIYLKPPAG